MSNLWVAVTCEYNGSTFSHRSEHTVFDVTQYAVAHHYNGLLDDAGGRVRRGLTSVLPEQKNDWPMGLLSDYEKVREIERIMEQEPGDDEALMKIEAVLKQ